MMLFEEFRVAIAAAPHSVLPEITSSLWRAFGSGALDESEAERLSALIEVRASVPRESRATAPARSPPARAGSRARTPDCLTRRRRWAASGWIPPRIAAHLTTAEAAVLSVIAWEASRRGDCRLPLSNVAALAGVGRSSVKRALALGRLLGLIAVEERRLSRRRNDTNVVRIASADWVEWLRLRATRGPVEATGVQSGTCRNTDRDRKATIALRNTPRATGRLKRRGRFNPAIGDTGGNKL